jgi:distribution and morphology protein 12
MSIDLDWLNLDASLASHVIDLLNRQLENAERPSFIGPVQVMSLDFGSSAPDVELVDLRDIYRDFLESDDDEDHGPVKVTEGGVNSVGMDDDEGYEWVSRRAGVRRDSTISGSGGHHHLPPHVRHHAYGDSEDYFAAGLVPSMDPWTSGLSRPPSFGTYRMQPFSAGTGPPLYRSPSPATPFIPGPPRGHHPEGNIDLDQHASINSAVPSTSLPPHHGPQAQEPTNELPPNPHPNLQLHLHVNWHSNLRISLQTSLLINYPSPMFMSLPIRLSITGLVFNGELAVAYEGERKRVHLCILDDLDPYGPAVSRTLSNSTFSLSSNSAGVGAGESFKDASNPSTPTGLDGSIIMGAAELGLGGLNSLGVGNTTLSSSNPNANNATNSSTTNAPTSVSNKNPLGYNPVTHSRLTKPVLPIGQRLLPSIFIESEIGQADKHVLKNVTRVERFIQDVIRKTVEEELVFPNFHTLVMGDGT